MLITKIEQQKRHSHRVNVYLDDEFAFGLHIDVLTAFGLKKGDHLSQEAIDAMLSREEFTLAKEQALRYLGYRRRTEKELRNKLFEKEFDPATIDAVIAYLSGLGIINDVEFAKSFIHDARLRKPLGKRLLRQKLRLKGVPAPIIETTLNENVSENEEQILAMEEAMKVVKRYRTSRKAVEQQKQQQRLAQHLARRGFSWATIFPVLKQVFKSEAPLGVKE